MDVFQTAWLSVSQALWEYRLENFSKAEEWCRQCLSYAEANRRGRPTAHIVFAMTYRQLDRGSEAQAELKAWREIGDSKFKGGLGGPWRDFWVDWIFCANSIAGGHWIAGNGGIQLKNRMMKKRAQRGRRGSRKGRAGAEGHLVARGLCNARSLLRKFLLGGTLCWKSHFPGRVGFGRLMAHVQVKPLLA